MEESNKIQKLYSIAEDFGVMNSIAEKTQTIRELKEVYGSDISLKELEEQLWAERNHIVGKIKSKL